MSFDVLTVFRSLALWVFESSAENASLASVVTSFLRPVKFAAVHIDRDTNAPIPRVKPVGIAMSRFHERFDVRAVEIRAHDSHSFAVRPVEFAVLRIELKLLGSPRRAGRDNVRDVGAVEVSTIDRAVVGLGISHICPVNVATCDVYHDTVGRLLGCAKYGF